MMLDFTKLWDKIYLLGPNPFEPTRSDWVFFWIAVAFVILAVVLKVMVRVKGSQDPLSYVLNRFFHLFLTTGLLVAVWFGARRENIPWIETHVVVLGLFLIWAIWFFFIVKYYFGKFQSHKKRWDEEQQKRKYLP